MKEAIIESENNCLFSVPYTPNTNIVEMLFKQIKNYLKLNKKWKPTIQEVDVIGISQNTCLVQPCVQFLIRIHKCVRRTFAR